VRIIHVDNRPQGATAKMLNAGVRAYNETLAAKPAGGRECVELQVMTADEFGRGREHYDAGATVLFISLTEEEPGMSSKVEQSCGMQSTSLSAAQDLLNRNGNLRIFMVPTGSGDFLTGIDAVAGLLWGASGYVDERGLIMEGTLRDVLSHRRTDRRFRSLLLIGSMCARVKAISDTLQEWNTDVDADATLDLASWRASLALAQLPTLEPILGSAQPFSFRALAEALNLARSVTSYRHTPDDLRRILSTLARRWLGENHEPAERVKLPEYARRNGFPRNPPYIVGLSGDAVSRMTYNLIQSAEIIRFDDLHGIPKCLVRARHLRRSAPRKVDLV
jgi:hypothetical protein